MNNFEKNFHIISFNYKNLSLEEREEFIKNGYKKIVNEYFEKGVIKGYVSVETCLRVELYLDVDINFFDINEFYEKFKIKKIKTYTGISAIKYLLKVICGLESIIKGEDQILAQIKKAYIEKLEENKTSKLLNIIFNNAIETGKKFRNESKINEKNISLDSIAVKFIKSKFDTLENKKIFVIGVGELSQSILALLHKDYNCELTMTNRSMRKSIEIKKLFENINTVEFNEKYKVIEKSDIIISATSAPHYVIEKNKMNLILNDNKKRFFLDLAVPRDIETSITEHSNIELYHLENIWEEYNKNVKKRDDIVEKYFYIIEEQVEKIFEKLEKQDKYSKRREDE